MTSTRGAVMAVALAVLAALALAGCSEVTVATPTPAPTAVPTLPPIGFNHRYGTSPVASADALALERTLFARGEFWEVAVATSPLASGFVDRADLGAVARARSEATGMTLVIATESIPTIRAFLAGGHPGQIAYGKGLLDALRASGYQSLDAATVVIYFGEQDRHALLSYTAAAGYSLKVFDGDLQGSAINPAPATPFQAVPTP